MTHPLNRLLIKRGFFHPILMKLGEVVLQFQQVSSNSDKKQKSFIKIAHLMEVSSVKVPLRSC